MWGLPLVAEGDGTVLGCAPPALRDSPVTDTLPFEKGTIIGATNAPTGWRGGIRGNWNLSFETNQAR